jgi:two-component system sensor histidine kinase/response regulator
MEKPSILVVDDDDDVRNMLCLVLSAEGYQAEGAADGMEALRRIRSDDPPALIFVDLMMPRMSGEDLIRTLTQDPSLPRIPIAIISGQVTSNILARTPRVIARLVKPVELDELLTVAHRFAD